MVCKYLTLSDFTERQCFSSNDYEAKENVFIKYQIHHIHLTVTPDEVSVLIESNERNMAIIWFGTDMLPNDSYHQSSIIDCNNTSRNEIKLSNLERQTAYTICLINMVDTTVSPLDCVSYYHYGAEVNGIWLLQSSKPLAISVIVGCLLISIIVGMVIGSIFAYRFSMKLHYSIDTTVSIQDTKNPNLINDLK